MTLLHWVVLAAISSIAAAERTLHPVRTRSHSPFVPKSVITLDYSELEGHDRHHYFADVAYHMRQPSILIKEHQETIMDAACPAKNRMSIDFSSEDSYNIAKDWPLPMYAVVVGGDGGCGKDDDKYHPWYLSEIAKEDSKAYTLTFTAVQSRWGLAASYHDILVDHTSKSARHHQKRLELDSRAFKTGPAEYKSSLAFNYNAANKTAANRKMEIWKTSKVKDLTNKQNKSTGTFEYKAEVFCVDCYTEGDVTLYVNTGSALGNAMVNSIKDIAQAGGDLVAFISRTAGDFADWVTGRDAWKRMGNVVFEARRTIDGAFNDAVKKDPIQETDMVAIHRHLENYGRSFWKASGEADPRKDWRDKFGSVFDKAGYRKKKADLDQANKEWIAYHDTIKALVDQSITQLKKPLRKRADGGVDTRAAIKVSGSLKTNVDILLSLEGEYTTKRFSKPLTKEIPLPAVGFAIPGLLTLGAYAQLLAVAEARFKANASFQTGFDLHWKDFSAEAVLGNIGASSTKLKPDVANFHKPNFTLGEVSMFGIQFDLGLALDLKKANKAIKSKIGLVAGAVPKLSYGANNDCDAGVEFEAGAELSLEAEAQLGAEHPQKRPGKCSKGALFTTNFDFTKDGGKDKPKRDILLLNPVPAIAKRSTPGSSRSALAKRDTWTCDLFKAELKLWTYCIDISKFMCKDGQKWSNKAGPLKIGGCVNQDGSPLSSSLTLPSSSSSSSSAPPASSSA